MKTSYFLLLGILLVPPGFAQVYKHVDEKGDVTFSDTPAPEAERVDISPTNTSAPPPAGAYPAPPPKADEIDAGPTYELAITSPEDQTIIPRGPGNFSVAASVSPSLQARHKLQLMLDGAPRQAPQTAPSWNLNNVFRGEHSIQVAVIDSEGKQLGISDPVRVYVFRPSTNDANRGRRIIRPERPPGAP